jgi:trimethylguanosine synthase
MNHHHVPQQCRMSHTAFPTQPPTRMNPPSDMTVIVQVVNLYDGPMRKITGACGDIEIHTNDQDENNNNEKDSDNDNGDGLVGFFDSPALSSVQKPSNNTRHDQNHRRNQQANNEPPPPVNLFYYCRPPPIPYATSPPTTLGTVKVYKLPEHVISKRFMSDTNHNIYMDRSVPNPNKQIHDKYWVQRRRLFSRFDRGIQLDAEGWYSVTPEIIADHVASQFCAMLPNLMKLKQRPQLSGVLPGTPGMMNGPQAQQSIHQQNQNRQQNEGIVLLDAFCGCGGNGISFAKLGNNVPLSLVVCVDVDRTKLRMAAHNASIYNIPREKIIFIQSDTLHVMANCYQNGRLVLQKRHASQGPSTLFERCNGYLIGGLELLPDRIDVVFMDPPWGGVEYGSVGNNGYDLVNHMKIPFGGGRYGESQVDDSRKGETGYANGADLLRIAAAATSSRIVLYDIPKNTNRVSLGQAALAAGYRGNIRLDEHYLNGRMKTATAYLGCDHCHLMSTM